MPSRIAALDFKPTPGRSRADMAWVAHLDDQTKLRWQVRPDGMPLEPGGNP